MRDRSSQLKAIKCVLVLTFLLLLATGALGQLTANPSTMNFGNVPLGTGPRIRGHRQLGWTASYPVASRHHRDGVQFEWAGVPGDFVSRSVLERNRCFQPSVRGYCNWRHFS